ncbi:ankyrin repeat-containing domain protein [Trichophaea hybrida]|nr:ankyrin repeat-containing domain protein [Trichophaea hybrida]
MPKSSYSEGASLLLLNAAKYSNVKSIRASLLAGADVSATNKKGRTALVEAAEHGDEEIVKMLLDAGADPNATDKNGRTALIEAASNGWGDIVGMLLSAGAEASASDCVGESAWMEVAKSGFEEVAQVLLEHKATDESMNYVLATAAMKGNTEIVKMLSNNTDNNDALRTAALFGCERSIVRILLDAGADANATEIFGESALCVAARNGHEEVVRELLDAGANANVIDRHGVTALPAAVRKGYEGIVRMLLQAGVDPNATDTNGVSVLSEAARKGHVGIVEMLLNAGAEASAVNEIRDLIFSAAAKNGQEITIKVLLESGADPNRLDKDGHTPLEMASQAGHKNIVKMLLAAHANIDQRPNDKNGIALHQALADMSARDSEGRTPLHIAASLGRLDILDYLLKLQTSDIDALDQGGLTPSNLALKRGHSMAYELLLTVKARRENEDRKRRILLQDALVNHDTAAVERFLRSGANMKGFTVQQLRALFEATDEQVLCVVENDVDSRSIVKTVAADMSFPPRSNARQLWYVAHTDLYMNLPALPALIQDRVDSRFIRDGAAVEWIWCPKDPSTASPCIPKPEDLSAQSFSEETSLNCYVHFRYFQQDISSQQQQAFGVLEQETRISWIMIPERHSTLHGLGSSNLGSGDDSMILWSRYFISSLDCCWIPDHGIELFHLCLLDLIQKWSELLNAAESYLINTHENLLEKKGRTHTFIETLLTDARMWATLQKLLADHIGVAEKFLMVYQKNYFLYDEVRYSEEKNKKTFAPINDPKIRRDLNEDIEDLMAIGERIRKLGDDTNSMIKLSLLGMNINLLENNPAWWWYFLVSGVVLFLVLLGWIIFKYIKNSWNAKWRGSRRKYDSLGGGEETPMRMWR